MKKRELILGAIALTGTVASMISTQAAYAALGCTAGTASAPMTCSGASGDSGSYLAEAVTFTGSNGVQMGVADSSTGVGLCGSHIAGNTHYGLSTNGGSMTSASGTGTAVNGSGCQ